MAVIQAIETHYAGCRFRSRLEARWTVFFSELGISWEYEVEGFETPAGRYLPDFRLKLHDRFVLFEIKPDHGMKPKEAQPVQDNRWHYVSEISELYVTYGLPKLSRESSFFSETSVGEFFSSDGFPRSDLYAGFLKIEPAGEYGWLNFFCECPCCWAIDIRTAGCMVDEDPATRMPNDPLGLESTFRFTCCGRKMEGHRGYYGDVKKILRAYDSARSARFEHGENPR